MVCGAIEPEYPLLQHLLNLNDLKVTVIACAIGANSDLDMWDSSLPVLWLVAVCA